MGNIFKLFFSLTALVVLTSCDVFLVQNDDGFQCETHLEKVYEKTPLNNFEQTKFKDLLENRFPKYKEMFEQAAEQTAIDSDLLAAIAFQESQWDPRAKSNMGVRGMMMVTLETAAIVGVEKRLNPEQNITGGAKYLAMLQDRNVYGKTTADQLSISLAKYNLGPTNIINIAKEIDKIPLHDVVIHRTKLYGKVRIDPVPPEEFLIERRCKSIDTANFVCHRVNKTRTELVEMGYDPDIVASLPTGDGDYYTEDKFTRHQSVDFSHGETDGDKSTQDVLIHECYVRMDVDGDGKAELLKITVAGDGKKLLDMEEIDTMPFVSMTPVIMPHRFYGRSVAELVEDIQLIKSTVMRQMLDNMYLTNNNRVAVQDGQVSMDDLLTNRPGGIVRTKQPPQNVMMPIQAQPITEQASGMLAYLDSVKETRTGVTRTSQGLDANTLNNSTATGQNQILTQSQMRMELIARIFAETGVKDLALKMFELTCKYQNKEKIVRIRGKYIPMRPYEWKDRVNITVQVGLGTGSKEQQLILMNAILERQMSAINLQQNVHGPMVNLRNIYNSLKKLVENAGLNSIEPYFMDPEVGAASMPPIPPKPPTEFEKVTLAQVQGENQRAQLKAETEAKNLEGKMRQALLDYELQIKEMELKYNTKIDELELKRRSMLEQTDLQKSGDLMGAIVRGQKQFFNDGQGNNNQGGQESPATAGRSPSKNSI